MRNVEDEELLAILRRLPLKDGTTDFLLSEAVKYLRVSAQNAFRWTERRLTPTGMATAREEIEKFARLSRELVDHVNNHMSLTAIEAISKDRLPGSMHIMSLVWEIEYVMYQASGAWIDDDKKGRTQLRTAAGVTDHAAYVYFHLTGREPDRGGKLPDGQTFPDFLSAIFNAFGITANVDHQIKERKKRRVEEMPPAET